MLSDKTFEVRIREIVALIMFVTSLAVAAGTYKSKFEDSQSKITNLTTTMEKLSGRVEALTLAIVKIETRLDYDKSK